MLFQNQKKIDNETQSFYIVREMLMKAYAGMANEYPADVLEDYAVTAAYGWKATRAAGILAMLLLYYPEMTLQDIAAWAYANGIEDWEFSTDPDDAQLIGGSGKAINFLDDYQLPSYAEWSADFSDWANGRTEYPLPVEVKVTAIPVTATQAAVQAATAAESFQQTTAPQIQPEPQYMQTANYIQSEADKSTNKAIIKYLIIGGIVILLIKMSKKGKR